jgi:threonine dehydratase
VTHSSGNHAQALALAAKNKGISAYIVMPDNAPKVKVDAVKEYGGIITFCEPTLVAREITAQKVINQTNAIFIHPYDNDNIIAGQGTCALEFLEQMDVIPDIIMAPVGGGGLLSGTAIAVKQTNSEIIVYAAEPKMADDAFKSFNSKTLVLQDNPQTIADGLLTSLSDKTFEIILKYVDDVLLCSEEGILLAMKLIYENLKIVVEPSGAVPLACVIENTEIFKNKTVGLIISGGNIDIENFNWQKKEG